MRHICEDFEKLHRFLREEEMLRVSALREEEDQKSHIIKEKIEIIDREIQSLSQKILNIKDGLATADMDFLQVRSHLYNLQDHKFISY